MKENIGTLTTLVRNTNPILVCFCYSFHEVKATHDFESPLLSLWC